MQTGAARDLTTFSLIDDLLYLLNYSHSMVSYFRHILGRHKTQLGHAGKIIMGGLFLTGLGMPWCILGRARVEVVREREV